MPFCLSFQGYSWSVRTWQTQHGHARPDLLKVLHIILLHSQRPLEAACGKVTATLVILKGDGQMLAGDSSDRLQGDLRSGPDCATVADANHCNDVKQQHLTWH